MTVLIAESSSILRSRLFRIATAALGDVRISAASNYEELIARNEQERPHLIIVDVFIAGGSALALLDEMHRSAMMSNVLVLMNTRDEMLAERLRTKGAMSVYLKDDDLVGAVATHKNVLPFRALGKRVDEQPVMANNETERWMSKIK